MADANTPVRLSKAAREFNLGIGTIVDFLETKGIQVEAKPNTKLDPEVYALVRSNFQGDKDAKEAAQRSSVSIDRENITLASTKKGSPVSEEPAEKIDLSIFKIEVAKNKEVSKKKQKKEEVNVEKPVAEEQTKHRTPGFLLLQSSGVKSSIFRQDPKHQKCLMKWKEH